MLLKVNVRNLYGFIRYVEDLGVSVVPGPHVVLTDSSEVGSWYLKIRDADIGYMIAHYVDNHYLALRRLGSDASDREVLEALIRADLEPRWAVPVEPIIIYVSDKENKVIEGVLRYKDEYPSDEGKKAYEEYMNDENSIGTLGDQLLKYRLSVSGR